MSRRSAPRAPACGGAGCPTPRARARALLEDPQGFGNDKMTDRDAYRILGLRTRPTVYRDGAIALDRREWADLGWMANDLGPSPRALEAMRAAVDGREHVGPATRPTSTPACAT